MPYDGVVMLAFSKDPKVAERQMQAIIFYLTTFGYIDGDFDMSEKQFVRDYIARLVEQRVKAGAPDAAPAVQAELTGKFTRHFHEVFEGIDRHVRDLFTEATVTDEDQTAFVHTRLKLRCFEIFKSFDAASQESLMESVDELIMADGEAHPAEVKFRAELSHLLEEDLGIEIESMARPPVRVSKVPEVHTGLGTHPFFDQFEHHYSSDPAKISEQIDADLELMRQARDTLDQQRKKGNGALTGKHKVRELEGRGRLLDGHVYVMEPAAKEKHELLVLGDLHGCYSCLKGALMQTSFFDKVAAYKKDPKTNPNPQLVLLGDYIDRGMFSLNGVLRAVLQTFVAAPDHVMVLRGNHEYYLEHKGEIYGGVKPAEAINTLKPHLPVEVFRNYMQLFEALPNVLLWNDVMFVHGGIPRDRLVKERYKDLSSLNDPDMRFQMMWSDPSAADVIPAELQEQSARFAFGRLQATAFLHRMGCHTLVRGHEKVDAGFERVYDDEDVVLVTVFSAGGHDNGDLPSDSSYRSVTPAALTVRHEGASVELIPWTIDYRTYNDPDHNAFFKAPPQITHRT